MDLTDKDTPLIIRAILDAILNDNWIYAVVWGQPRSGKSTFCLTLMYEIYKDWNKVLSAVFFNLNQLIYKIKKGEPERWPTYNKLHMRVPILTWDDFAAHSGKAATQHQASWDYFKGAFDTLGTKIGVLLVNMVSPRSPTQQLQEKYTHEIWVYRKGHYKYDRVKWSQDYRGWSARMNKDWQQEGRFGEVPPDVFKEYDAMRMELADEVLHLVEEQVVDTHMSTLKRRVKPDDLKLLKLIVEKGPLHSMAIQRAGLQDVTIRCKARGLITPVRQIGGKSEKYYKYDLTNLGEELLKEKEKDENLKEEPGIVI